MNNLQALTIIWNALHDYRENSISEGEQANDDAWDEITHAMAMIHESLDIASRRHRLIRSCLDAR
jgi:hypothetical protein